MARHAKFAASLLAGAFFVAPAFAQDNATGGVAVPDPTTGTQTDTAVQPTGGSSGATASTGATIDGKAAMAAIAGTSDSARHLGTISAVSDIHVVKLSDLAGADPAALKEEIAKSKSAISGLRSTLDANAALAAKLKEKSVETKSVVAATVEADGSVTIFVTD